MSELKVNKISPATGTAFALGDSGDTFTVPSGASIVNSGTATGFGGGKILQCLQVVKTDIFDMAVVTTFTDITGMAVAITPAATSSKILITAYLNVGVGASGEGHLRIAGGNTATFIGDAASSRTRCAGSGGGRDGRADGMNAVTLTYLDSPSTTSAVTYKIQMMNPLNNAAHLNRSGTDSDAAESPRAASSITVYEIGV